MKTLENSQSHSNSFLKTTILNIYQTSVYYFRDESTSETTTEGGGTRPSRTLALGQPRAKENSDKYFIVLFWLFVCVKLRYDVYVLVPVLVVVWKVARLFVRLVVELMVSSAQLGLVKQWFRRRHSILVPRPVRLVVALFRKGDHKCTQVISSSMDTIVTAFIMVTLMLAVVCSAIVLCIQVRDSLFCYNRIL